MEQYNEIRRRAIENATLLWSLNELPESPRENTATAAWPESAWKRLPANREKQLADDLAFVASSKDDCVLAVCVEERRDGEGLIFRVASNTGDLSPTVQSLETIAGIMVRARRRESSKSEARESLFRHLVETCKSRILTRLRSKHVSVPLRKIGKPPLPPLLLRTVTESEQRARGEVAKARAAKTKLQCEKLDEAFERLEICPDSNSLCKPLAQLLILAHEFDVDPLVATMEHDKTVTPSTGTYLPEAIRKLGRYYQIAINLTNAARTTRHSLFQNIVVEPVRCNTIDRQSLNTGLSDFETALSRAIGGSTGSQNPAVKLVAQRKYRERMFGCTTRWKVHAEIQILLFYELNPQLPRPRVICASKSACYLCDLFFRLHGKFEVPRTHGKIYDKWTLPDWRPEQLDFLQDVNSALLQLNDELERKSVRALREKRTRRGPPNESVVGIYEPWSSNSTIRPVQATSTDSLGLAHSSLSIPDDRNALQAGHKTPTAQSSSNLAGSAVATNLETIEESPRERAVSQGRARLPATLPEQTTSDESDSSSSLSSDGRLCKEVREGENFRVRTREIHFDFSIAPSRDARKGGNSEVWNTFLVTVERDSSISKTADDDVAKPFVVDLDALRPGQDTVVSVGAAAPITKLLCRANRQEIAVTFGLSK